MVKKIFEIGVIYAVKIFVSNNLQMYLCSKRELLIKVFLSYNIQEFG